MGAMSPWHWAIVALVVIILFGSKKLPDAARGLGRAADRQTVDIDADRLGIVPRQRDGRCAAVDQHANLPALDKGVGIEMRIGCPPDPDFAGPRGGVAGGHSGLIPRAGRPVTLAGIRVHRRFRHVGDLPAGDARHADRYACDPGYQGKETPHHTRLIPKSKLENG